MPETLLVADDSPTIQRVVKLAFADEHVDVVAVSSGAQAITQIEARPPAIVLADTRMPDRNGYEIAEFVHAQPAFKGIPVVLMTGAFEPVDDGRARAAGCEAVLVKPFEPEKLVSTVRELLRGRAAPAADLSVDTPPITAPPDDLPVVTTPTQPPAAATSLAESPLDGLELTFPAEADLRGSRPEPPPPTRATTSVAPPVAPVVPQPMPTAAEPPVLVVTDELVDRLATRVIARLSDRVVRETTAEVVTRVAERLVSEEIERLKSKLR